VDDESDIGPLKYALVQTSMEEGLTEEHVDKIIEIQKGKTQ